jgi:hypothetical protein
MPVIRMLCCAALLAVAFAAPDPVSAAVPHRVAVGKHRAVVKPGARARQCSLPVDTNHLPHPVLSARLNRDRTVTFHGRTCPGLLIGVFEVHGKRVRNIAEDLVCDDLADRQGVYSCTSLRRYPISTKFGVVISGQFIVGLQVAAVPPPRHPRRPRPHGAPETGFGGMARSVARHHLREPVSVRHPHPARARNAQRGSLGPAFRTQRSTLSRSGVTRPFPGPAAAGRTPPRTTRPGARSSRPSSIRPR